MPANISDCRDALSYSNIYLRVVSDIGWSDVGKAAMGSVVREEVAALLVWGPLTSMLGSLCCLFGEAMHGLHLEELLIEGLDAPKEDPFCVVALWCFLGSPMPSGCSCGLVIRPLCLGTAAILL